MVTQAVISFSSVETKFVQNQHFLKNTSPVRWNARDSEWVHVFWVTIATLLLGKHLSPSSMLSLCPPVQSGYFIPLATESESDMGPWPKIGKLGEGIYFLCVLDCNLETSMKQYCCPTQKPNNKAKQGRDVQIGEERIGRKKKGEEGGRRGRLDGIIWTPGPF